MPKQIYLLILAACLGLVSVPTVAYSQALLPYSPKQDPKSLEDTSKSLLRQAAGLVQFQQFEQAIPKNVYIRTIRLYR